METRQVLLADAFADEPLGGNPVAVVPDGEGLSGPLLRRIGGEFGAAGVVTLQDGRLSYFAGAGTDDMVAGAVAGGTALVERGRVDPGTHTLEIAGVDAADTGADPEGDGEGAGLTEQVIEIDADHTVRVTLSALDCGSTSATNADLADALGIDVAAIDDVSADLPAGRIDGYGGTLVAPVNFLEHLSRADPGGEDLTALLADAGADRLCAFTFDTLGNDTDLHARTFDPRADGCEVPASGVAVGACGAHLAGNPVFDGERSAVRVECGRFLDRPATIGTTLADAPAVSGKALTVLDGTLTLPPEDDDEIIEV